MNLAAKKCVACEGGAQPLSGAEAERFAPDVPGWTIGERAIAREFAFKNFAEAMAFANRVAELAEREGHHPDILVHGWNKVRLELSTHAIGGLSENDFILAAKINAL